MSSRYNKTLPKEQAATIYDPLVVDSRLEYLNNIFKSEAWQEFLKDKKEPKKNKGSDPEVKHLENWRKQHGRSFNA